MNIIQYIKLHKDEDFTTFKFTEVDNLIFSLIPYINWTDVVPAFKKKKITIKEAALIIQTNPDKYRGLFINNTYKMMQIMKETKRYGNLQLYNYMRVVNDEMQFGAITIKLDDGSIYIAYAGTDTSIVGWEEDFKMAYLYPVASQKYAAIYLNKAINLFSKKVRIGGHSKGGNLAISAAMSSKFYLQKKILAIYNNDGPGFLKEQVNSKKYLNIKGKIKMYVPEESIIGMILYHQDEYTVVKAKGFNILQHDAFNWICNEEAFVKSTQHKRSKKIEMKLTEKLEELPTTQRIKIVHDLFLIFKKNEIKDTKDINIGNILTIIKDFKSLDKETQDLILKLLSIVFLTRNK